MGNLRFLFFFFFSKSGEKPLEILEQGDNIICFGGKLEFLNSVRKMLTKPLGCAS